VAYELLLLVDDAADQTTQLATLAALVDADLLHRPFQLSELRHRFGVLARADDDDQDGGAHGAGEEPD
jgi:hypothetical protein